MTDIPHSESLAATDAASAAVQKTPNRVTLSSIHDQIAGIEYHHPRMAPHMTIAFVHLKNGYIVIGKSAPADAGNFDAELGKKFSVEDAIRQIWPLEAYALLERLRYIPPQA